MKSVSKDCSSIGDSSIKLTPFTQDYYYLDFRSINLFDEVGKSVTFTADVCSNYDCKLVIYTYTGSYSQLWTLIPANTPGTYSVSRTIPLGVEHILYRVEPCTFDSGNCYCYTDNWRLNL